MAVVSVSTSELQWIVAHRTSCMGVLCPPGGESWETGGEFGPESGLLLEDSTANK